MAEEQKNPVFNILRIFNKDISLETPNSPVVFSEEWKPETRLDLNIEHSKVENVENVYEVVLRITVTVKLGEKTAFLCEVNQAGLFNIENIPEEQMEHMCETFIPTILYPYARETISSLVTKATFPPLNLAPLNFDVMYQQKKAHQAEQQAKESK